MSSALRTFMVLRAGVLAGAIFNLGLAGAPVAQAAAPKPGDVVYIPALFAADGTKQNLDAVEQSIKRKNWDGAGRALKTLLADGDDGFLKMQDPRPGRGDPVPWTNVRAEIVRLAGMMPVESVDLPTDPAVKKDLARAGELLKEDKEESWEKACSIVQALLDRKEDVFLQTKFKDDGGKESERWSSAWSESVLLLKDLPAKAAAAYERRSAEPARKLFANAKEKKDPILLAEAARRYPLIKTGDEARQALHAELGRLDGETTVFLVTDRAVRARFMEAQDLLKKAAWDDAVRVLQSLLDAPQDSFVQRYCQDEKGKGTVVHVSAWAEANRLLGFVPSETYERHLGEKAKALRADATKPAEQRLKENQKKTRTDILAETARRYGHTRAGREAKKELDKIVPKEPADLDGWPMFRGNPSRSAPGRGDLPFLDESVNMWVQATIRQNQTEQWVAQAIASQENRQQTATLPGFFPIAAKGLIVFRSYLGVHAVDLKSGKLKWEVDSDWSMDKMVADPAKMAQLNQWVPMYQQSGQQSIIYENSTLGTLSTDNHLVFCIDDLALPPHPSYLAQFMWGGRPNMGLLDDVVHHNRLIGIDLESGKRKWAIGGRGDQEELNDSFFLGPPLPLDGKLYVLTEKNSEIRLACLEAATGAVQWIKALAGVRDPIVRDVGRRIQAVHLAYSDGVLVCPTHAGTVLGVDLLTHGLLWAQNYRETVPVPEVAPIQRRGMPIRYGQSILSEWKCSAPIVQDSRVVFTAPDGLDIYCLNLRDGTRIWKSSRADDLYLAGVRHGKVLLAGKNSCRALSLADGKPLWSVETGLPSGFGAAGDSIYYLPLKSSNRDPEKKPEVCAVDIQTGRILGQVSTRKKELPGNLLLYDGKVVSQTVFNVTAYPTLKNKLAEIDDRLKKNPRDPAGLTERAEYRICQGNDLPKAVEDLRTALANQPDAATFPLAQKLLFQALTILLERDFQAGEKYLEEYRKLCQVVVPKDAPAEERKQLAEEQRRRQEIYFSLVGKGRERQGKLSDALEVYLELAGLGDSSSLLTPHGETALKVRGAIWAGCRVAELFAASAQEQRPALEETLARRWKKIRAADDVEAMRGFTRIAGLDQPLGREARLFLAEHLLKNEAFLEAELQLLPLSRQRHDLQRAAQATEALARLYTRKQLLEDAYFEYSRLGRDFSQTIIRDNKTGSDLFNELKTDRRFLLLNGPNISWEGKIKFQEEVGQFQQAHQMFYFEPEGEISPFVRQHRLAFNMNQFQLKLIDRASNEELWSHSLQRQQQNNLQYLHASQHNPNGQNFRFSYHVQGHLAVFNLGLMVYGLDLVEHKVLWEKNLFGDEVLPVKQIILNPNGGLSALLPDGRVERIGQVVLVEPEYVCLLTRQGLAAFDPYRGTVLWTRTDVPSLSQIFGDREYLYAIEVRRDGVASPGKAYRARDGVEVKVPDFSKLYRNRIGNLGRILLLSEQNAAGEGLTLRFHDVHTGADLWKKEFSKKAVVLRSDDPELAGVVEPNNEGKLTILDLRTRKELLQSAMDPKDLDKALDIHLLHDRDLFYVIVNGPANPQLNPWGGPWPNLMNGMRGLVANGKLYAFDRATGKVRWKNDVLSQVLILEQYQDLPILLFSCRSQQLVNNGVQQVTRTRSIEKRTGKIIHDKESLNTGTQFHSLRIDRKTGTIDLISYNLKIRHFVEKEK